ncbi:S41 family peptidase [Ignatzschineria rhizosphaerae]|uniref:S41 family peptidase n=1 Tax=Ignatzschineria rhizosphaerae TaxID=2923279 RepID=A0ABY3X0P5_9GAMM|nr:S41 family peptidase [Ignatzschineria rhizosphaerae]UNM96474.1 S41 family peptidase [Ignatzschineria rhizosphaerae]
MKKQMLPLLFFWILSTLSAPLIAKETTDIIIEQQNIELISKPEPSKMPIDELRLFSDIFEQLKNNYVDPISDKELIQNAIKGMLALDPHSKYYPKEEYQRIQNQTSGSFAGIGIETRLDANHQVLIIEKVFDNSPAFKAQLKVKDQITKINNEDVSMINPKEYENTLQGKVDTNITLTILREGETFDYTLKRQNIHTPSLSNAQLYNHEFAYFKLGRFQQKSDEELVNALMALEVEAKTENSEIHGVILDLRDNRGGLLTAAIAVADLFLDEGLITYTSGQSERFKDRYEAKKGDIITDIPLIILINSQSASGSEIVAGALQDHSRALIVGERSYGKGSIQSIQPLKNGDAIRYTSARYYTPNGNSIQNYGITPDVILPNISAKINTQETSREVDNIGHLENSNDPNNQSRMPANFADLIEQGDFPLYEALNILKAISYSSNIVK